MKLRIILYGEHALTLETDEERWIREAPIATGPGLRRMSVAWDETPAMRTVRTWLNACLPENGTRIPYLQRAQMLRAERGASPEAIGPADVLWGNTDADYPGAVRFERAEDEEGAETEGYASLSEQEIGERLYEASRVAIQEGKGPAKRYPERRTSLSGMRGKIGLTPDVHGGWRAATGGVLNTWIAKREDSARLRGEAGVESICQDVMGLVGIPAAKTASRVFAGQQCVLSERSDRYRDTRQDEVMARHQEEFCQAADWPGESKYDGGTRREPRWEHAYRVLAKHAADAAAEQGLLTRVLVASWLIGHTDLHRRNLGFSHTLGHEPMRVRLAPVYDVSSGVGTHLDQTLAIGIARQQSLSRLGPVQWMQHARECGQDEEETLAIVGETARQLPDAITSARERAKTRDENRWQSAVDRRVDAMLAYTATRTKAFEDTLGTMRRKGARGLE